MPTCSAGLSMEGGRGRWKLVNVTGSGQSLMIINIIHVYQLRYTFSTFFVARMLYAYHNSIQFKVMIYSIHNKRAKCVNSTRVDTHHQYIFIMNLCWDKLSHLVGIDQCAKLCFGYIVVSNVIKLIIQPMGKGREKLNRLIFNFILQESTSTQLADGGWSSCHQRTNMIHQWDIPTNDYQVRARPTYRAVEDDSLT